MREVDLYRRWARYNAWMNGRIYALCAGLDDAERRRDRGAFFGSLHSTLNHLLWGDRAWLDRLSGQATNPGPIGVDLYDSFADLRSAREELDRAIQDWADSLEPADLDGDLTWTSATDGRQRIHPKRLCIAHLFNHQAHHRGQATTLLSQCGLDPGVTDLPFMPGFE